MAIFVNENKTEVSSGVLNRMNNCLNNGIVICDVRWCKCVGSHDTVMIQYENKTKSQDLWII